MLSHQHHQPERRKRTDQLSRGCQHLHHPGWLPCGGRGTSNDCTEHQSVSTGSAIEVTVNSASEGQAVSSSTTNDGGVRSGAVTTEFGSICTTFDPDGVDGVGQNEAVCTCSTVNGGSYRLVMLRVSAPSDVESALLPPYTVTPRPL